MILYKKKKEEKKKTKSYTSVTGKLKKKFFRVDTRKISHEKHTRETAASTIQKTLHLQNFHRTGNRCDVRMGQMLFCGVDILVQE